MKCGVRGAGLVVALGLVAGCSGTPSAGPSPGALGHVPAPAPVQAAARALVRQGAVSAIVAVQQDGRILAAADPQAAPSARAVTPAARPFRIGSVTKVFTATVVLQLVRQGRIGLDVPARRYLGPIAGLDRRVTIRELLQHRSGLPDYTTYADWLRTADASTSIGPRDVVHFALSHPPLFEPGAQWRYANTNYIVLGLVVEAVTRHRFADELAVRIAGPLHLTATRLPTTRTVPGLSDPGINPGVPWTAGGIVSTAHDLAAFLSALLSGRLLDRAGLAEMRQAVPTPLGVRYGLGLMASSLSCGTFWGHTGGTLDYQTQAWASPDGRRVLVISTRGKGRYPVPSRLLLCP